MSGRGAWAARRLLDFLRSLLGSRALEQGDRHGSPLEILAWAGVRGIDGRPEVCERTAADAIRQAAAALPGVVRLERRYSDRRRSLVVVRLRHFTRFAAGLAEVASITPEILAVAWENRLLGDDQKYRTDSDGDISSTHAGKLEHPDSTTTSGEARADGASGGCASPPPAEEAVARPATPPARAGDAPLFPSGSNPCKPKGARSRPAGRVSPTCSRLMFETPASVLDLIAGGLQGGLRSGCFPIAAVSRRGPFVALARELLERKAVQAAHESEFGEVEPVASEAIQALAAELRRVARRGGLVRDGRGWTLRIASNPILELESVPEHPEARAASPRMRRALERLGVPAVWAREMGREEARKLQFSLAMEVVPLRCPRLDVEASSYRWRRAKVQPRRQDPRFRIASVIRRAGGAWSEFERSARAGVAPDPGVVIAVRTARLTSLAPEPARVYEGTHG